MYSCLSTVSSLRSYTTRLFLTGKNTILIMLTLLIPTKSTILKMKKKNQKIGKMIRKTWSHLWDNKKSKKIQANISKIHSLCAQERVLFSLHKLSCDHTFKGNYFIFLYGIITKFSNVPSNINCLLYSHCFYTARFWSQ